MPCGETRGPFYKHEFYPTSNNYQLALFGTSPDVVYIPANFKSDIVIAPRMLACSTFY